MRQSESIICICNYCGISFANRLRAKDNIQKFCSTKCSGLHQTKTGTKEIVCFNCGTKKTKPLKELQKSKSGNHFCSRSCAATYNNKIAPKRERIKRQCKKCTNVFIPNLSSSKRLCSSCAIDRTNSVEYKNMTIGEYRNKLSVKGKHISWLHSHVGAFNRLWNKDLRRLPCQKCNYAKHVELAHIKPVKDFENSALLGEVNNPNNILVLCPNCHWEFDNGHLSILDIPKRD